MSTFSPGAEMAQLAARQTRRGSHSRLRTFPVLIVAGIVVLSVQGWFGDTVNIFLAPSHGIAKPAGTLGGFVAELGKLPQPFFLYWHAAEGTVLVVLAAVITVLAFAWSRSAGLAGGARWWSVVGLLSVLSAALGGYLFVISGFANGGNSAQMGGSFIAAYASYFMTLYYTMTAQLPQHPAAGAASPDRLPHHPNTTSPGGEGRSGVWKDR